MISSLIFFIFFSFSSFLFADTESTLDSSLALASNKAIWIHLEGDVNKSMLHYAERAIGEAIEQKPDYIIFEINTFGGELHTAFSIVDTILSIKDIKTVSLVQKKAISAGALIALASQELYMLEGTTIGDCAPIIQGSDGSPVVVGEKIQSPLRAKFRNLAQRNHYPELLSAAMVSPELEVLEFKHKDSILIIEAKDYAKLSDPDKKLWGAPKVLVHKDELLTMTEKEALDLGFSKATLSSKKDLESKLQITQNTSIQTTTSEKVSRFIAAISGILLIIGFGALYLEFKTPGFGLFGIIGIVAIAIVFLGQYANHIGNYLPIILLVIGVLLFVVEILVLPGTFLFGVAGILMMIIALAMTFSFSQLPSFIPEALNINSSPILFGLFFISLCAILALIFPIFVSKYILTLLPANYSPILSEDLADALSPTENLSSIRVGSIGVSKTFLRPVGHAEFNGQLLDVQTRGEIIEIGEKVEVTLIQDGRLWVQKHNTL
ncbi:MAG: nodulation efficiency protein D (NfeD) family protein [Fibrobacter sp.]|nr:nodulation efficiency protein D (NfeD) family protein [Fibrobacter sp.]